MHVLPCEITVYLIGRIVCNLFFYWFMEIGRFIKENVPCVAYRWFRTVYRPKPPVSHISQQLYVSSFYSRRREKTGTACLNYRVRNNQDTVGGSWTNVVRIPSGHYISLCQTLHVKGGPRCLWLRRRNKSEGEEDRRITMEQNGTNVNNPAFRRPQSHFLTHFAYKYEPGMIGG